MAERLITSKVVYLHNCAWKKICVHYILAYIKIVRMKYIICMN